MSKGKRHREERKTVYVPANIKERKKEKRNSILIALAAILIGAGLIALIIAGTVKDSGSTYKRTTALEINGKTVKADELQFYYKTIVASYKNYSDMFETYYGIENYYGCDFDANLFKQAYSSDAYSSWGEFIRESAIQQLYSNTLLSDAAAAAGFTLGEDELAEIESTMSSLETSAKNNGISMLYLLKLNYGNAITVEKYRSYLEKESLADAYAQKIYDGFDIAQDAVDKEYSENKDTYDRVDYRYFTYTVAVNEGEDTTAVVNAKTEEIKNAIAALADEAAFNEYVAELTKTVDSDGKEVAGKTAEDTLKTEIAKSNVTGTENADFLFNAERQAGDYLVTSSEKTISVVYFISRSDQSYLTRTFRQILLKSDKESDEVKAKLQTIYDNWASGLKTEESFAQFAKDNSEDLGEDKMGLYENVYHDQMTEEVNDWLYDENRKPGDAEIIFSEAYGYHLMYYVGEGKPCRDVFAEATVRQNRYNDWFKELETASPITRYQKGINLVK